MKKYNYSFLLLFVALFVGTSCNQDEGFGGSSSLEGYVYNVVHQDDDFTFHPDTFPALGKTVYLGFGNDKNEADDIDVGLDGYYRFDHLRKGNYTVWILSEEVSGQKIEEIQKVRVGGGRNQSPAIYIHSGKAYGTAMVSGTVWVKYYNKGSLVKVNGQDSIPALETRVFIKNIGEKTYFDDVRVSDVGIFVFQKIQPNKQYEVYVSTEIPGDQYKNILLPSAKKVDVGDAYLTYPLDEMEKLEFTIIKNN